MTASEPSDADEAVAPGDCAHCGLPAPRSAWSDASPGSAQEDDAVFCCFGCRIAHAISREKGERGTVGRTLAGLGLSLFFTMNVMAFTMALWSPDVYGGEAAAGSTASTFDGLFRHLVMLFSIPVFFILGKPLFESALDGLGRRIFSTDLLLSVGVIASFVYSAISVARGSGPVYFEVGCVVLMMVTLGRWLEATGKLKANDALDRLARLMPETVRRLVADGEETVPLDEAVPGDLLRVLPGERIPTDGVVRSGTAFVDQQVITGESAPEVRSAGDAVLGGSLDLDGDLVVEVGATGATGALARLIDMVRKARSRKGAAERLADRVSSWFFPTITVVAFGTLLVSGFNVGWEEGMLRGLAVVLIACPCALGLATPLAVWTALGSAAERQVLFRGGEAVERLASIRAVRFDKTGTLTTGEPVVADLLCADESERERVIECTRLIAAASSHVLARAALRFCGGPSEEEATEDARTHAGRGVSGVWRVNGRDERILLGSRRFLDESGVVVDRRLDMSSRSDAFSERPCAWIAWGGRARGLFAFDEELRATAQAALEDCRALGLDVAVLTGDRPERGVALERTLGVPVAAGLLPEDKVAAIQNARETVGPTAMIGDGVNDAPALAAGDVGVALACGTDLSRDTAAVCLLGDDPARLPWAVALARRTVSVVRWNLFWAFGYNAVGVACAAVGWLSPSFAAFLMVGSSGFVILNSLRLNASTEAA